uniref:Uncharacterized protein n=1 Tax=Anguilla anguilla TaxID=7936 RepID=A0A0E9WJ88_ANGAN
MLRCSEQACQIICKLLAMPLRKQHLLQKKTQKTSQQVFVLLPKAL